MALLSRNIANYEFLIGEKILLEKGLLEKPTTTKTFEYLFTIRFRIEKKKLVLQKDTSKNLMIKN